MVKSMARPPSPLECVSPFHSFASIHFGVERRNSFSGDESSSTVSTNDRWTDQHIFSRGFSTEEKIAVCWGENRFTSVDEECQLVNSLKQTRECSSFPFLRSRRGGRTVHPFSNESIRLSSTNVGHRWKWRGRCTCLFHPSRILPLVGTSTRGSLARGKSDSSVTNSLAGNNIR